MSADSARICRIECVRDWPTCHDPRVTSDRESLLGAFTADEEADTACRSALAAGAVYREPSDGVVESANLVTIYDRRARHLAKGGVATIGFERAVERLRLIGGPVRIGSAHADDFNYVFFVDATESVVVSCCGVAASAASPEWDWSRPQ